MRQSKILTKNNLPKQVKGKEGILHIILIGTKPDIIKQAPLILELKKQKKDVLVIHSGQHYDWNLSGSLEKEFGILPDINLNVRGFLYEQQSQIIGRLGSVLSEIKKMGRKILPYIYGDTTTALAGGIASFANLISTAHVEAGLRTMSPDRQIILGLLSNFDVKEYFNELKENSSWVKGSYEPYPEQFDTRAAAPSVGIHLAPTRLNADSLLLEGYPAERIYIVGNLVVDAINYVRKLIPESKVFDRLPVLLNGGVIRFCIHRRENVSCFQRFSALYEAMIDLVREGRTILFISLGATEKALEFYQLKRKTIELAKKYKNFIYSPVWPSYVDVIAVMEKCSVVATDSGSIQEEANILGVPGAVLRFNTDRPEAVFAGSNILVPPIRKEIVLKIIREVADNQELNKKMREAPKIYGEEVSKKMIRLVEKTTKEESTFNIFNLMEHERLGLDRKPFWRKGEASW